MISWVWVLIGFSCGIYFTLVVQHLETHVLPKWITRDAPEGAKEKGSESGILFETFGHPIAPLKVLDDLLSRDRYALPDRYAWEMVVDQYDRPVLGKGTTVTIHLMDYSAVGRAILDRGVARTAVPPEASYEIDLTYYNPGAKKLWEAVYRASAQSDLYTFSDRMRKTFLPWAEARAVEVHHQVTSEISPPVGRCGTRLGLPLRSSP